MCRSIKPLFNFDPPASADEIEAAARQFVRKLSGYSKPSAANAEVFERAVSAVAADAQALLGSLVTSAPTRNREIVATKTRVKAAKRFA